MKKIILVSILIHVVLLVALAPWLKTRMEFNKAEEAKRAEEVRKREIVRQELERKKREERKLDRKTAEKLKRDAEERKRQELEEQVEELRELRDEIMERQQQELTELQKRDLQNILQAEAVVFERQAQEIYKQTETMTYRAQRRDFTVGNYTNADYGVDGLIDNVAVYLKKMEPTYPTPNYVHDEKIPKPDFYWNFDGDVIDAITGKAGKLERDAKLVDTEETGGQAFQGTGRAARARFWAINFGTQFTIVLDVKLQPKNRDQLLVANCHSNNYNEGFRLIVEEGDDKSRLKFVTSGRKREKGYHLRSLPESFEFDRWHQVAVIFDQANATARLFIDGKDVTDPEGEVATKVATAGSTIDGTLKEQAKEFVESIKQEMPTPENTPKIMEKLADLSKKLDQRMEETPDMHDVRHAITKAKEGIAEMTATLENLAPKTDLAMMNETSASKADKLQPESGLDSEAEKSSSELYTEAIELEQQIAEANADINASNQAVDENTSYENARNEVSATTPPRPNLSEALKPTSSSNSPTTVGQYDEFRKTLDKASNEVQDMTARAETLLGRADNKTMPSSTRPGSSFSSRLAMSKAATQSRGFGTVVDLTGFGNSNSIGESEGMRGDFSGEGADMKMGEAKISWLSLNAHDIAKKALPGRRFTRNSTRRGWLYLDTWYVIGPWENDSKVDFEVRHQPEYEIDFDARYYNGKFADKQGHRDQVLKWEFYQSDQVRSQPPRVYAASTYYAYTDVWFEEARDMLIAVASDDAASLWLNDQIIWQDTGQSVWSLGEGYRRVRFKKGYNNILVRIENGPIHCVWSVLLCPPEAMRKK